MSAEILKALLDEFTRLDEPGRKELAKVAMGATKGMAWVPNPGPQAMAAMSEADELFYGGQAGGGKTDLAIGLALTQHKRSLLLRRINRDAVKLVPRIEEIVGSRSGWNGQDRVWRLGDGRQIDIAGCELEGDKQRFKGDPHDLIVFDEGTDFLESQFRFIIGWNRSADPGQRCRVLVTSNPPTTADGLWVIKYWAPWLDDTHPNPAKPGELRWYTTIGGQDVEVDGPGPHIIPDEPEPVMARSRTFIPAKLSDNYDLARTGYASVLAALPPELRAAYRDGRFDAGLRDADFQVIPTAWIRAAQDRWSPKPPPGAAMVAMGFDPAGGGQDAAVLARRYGGWYDEMIAKTGEDTADGSSMAALVMRFRRDQAPVVIDVGGGYAGAVIQRLKDNGLGHSPFNGANASTATDRSGQLKFANKRAEAWWRFREALDPDQDGGSIIALPPDPELRADLAAPTWSLTPRGVQLESKDDIRKRLGRSPGRGDAVVMALSEGDRARTRAFFQQTGKLPPVKLGYANLKRH